MSTALIILAVLALAAVAGVFAGEQRKREERR